MLLGRSSTTDNKREQSTKINKSIARSKFFILKICLTAAFRRHLQNGGGRRYLGSALIPKCCRIIPPLPIARVPALAAVLMNGLDMILLGNWGLGLNGAGGIAVTDGTGCGILGRPYLEAAAVATYAPRVKIWLWLNAQAMRVQEESPLLRLNADLQSMVLR